MPQSVVTVACILVVAIVIIVVGLVQHEAKEERMALMRLLNERADRAGTAPCGASAANILRDVAESLSRGEENWDLRKSPVLYCAFVSAISNDGTTLLHVLGKDFTPDNVEYIGTGGDVIQTVPVGDAIREGLPMEVEYWVIRANVPKSLYDDGIENCRVRVASDRGAMSNPVAIVESR
jgi:hypothetical protein